MTVTVASMGPEKAQIRRLLRRKANVAPDKWVTILAYGAKRRRESPNKATYNRRADLKKYYGITLEQWNDMFAAQGRRCAACGTDDPGRKSGRWSTDHCHKTGIVRGILCNGCNIAAGYMNDEPERCRLLAKYLEKGVCILAGP